MNSQLKTSRLTNPAPPRTHFGITSVFPSFGQRTFIRFFFDFSRIKPSAHVSCFFCVFLFSTLLLFILFIDYFLRCLQGRNVIRQTKKKIFDFSTFFRTKRDKTGQRDRPWQQGTTEGGKSRRRAAQRQRQKSTETERKKGDQKPERKSQAAQENFK